MKPALLFLGSAFAGAVLLALPARVAHASVTYPAELSKHWELDALPAPPPHCTLCHTSDSGGTGTVTKPFGRALSAVGALGNNVPSLDGALDALEAAGTDSDRDGVSDRDELRAGANPNEGEPLPGAAPDPLAGVTPPQSGCSTRKPTSTGGLVGAFLSLLLASRRACARTPKERAPSRKRLRTSS